MSNNNNSPLAYSGANGFSYSHHPYGARLSRPQGPILLQDTNLIESISHFDRERIPERVVHAKGGGARFEFELTDSLSDITFAAPYQTVGYKCPGMIRVSTVGGESGTPDTARDPRGFSFKFYTEWGNHDWVFNNTPIFFIRDGNKFPHFIHTQKRNPQTHLNNGEDSNMFWDYLVQNPESIHQITYMFGPRGTPASWASMNAYSGHTFKMINEQGDLTYVQFHVLSDTGFETLTSVEASKLSGEKPDYNFDKLFKQLKNGEKLTYSCYVQTMTPKQAEEFRYSVNDLTKVWPHAQFPLRKFGKITLTENIDNYFAEIEQIAFSPSNTCIPGIEPSNDNVLQTRLYSYPDTQRHRLGANFTQLPINRPRNLNLNNESPNAPFYDAPMKCPYAATNFQRDGPMQMYNQGSLPNYISNQANAKIQFKDLTTSQLYANKFKGLVLDVDEQTYIQQQEAERTRHENAIDAKLNDYYTINGISPLDFEQPRALYEKVFDDSSRRAFIENVVAHASNAGNDELKLRVAQYFGLLNQDLGAKLALGLGVQWVPVDLEGYANAIGISSPF
ncbi:hypothetical protein Kpol_284p1 [Vanderwaltozyma polyspora DSM 70294]|uniref:Catalase T n=1 Tax=Vanderwaltozyma polyspora (strain ATCC 22028 / DSM 70294 / BCRC 21397 / CBS 2163 / NBRC 10782 / NRRL Y-8283 / UCD 57-17) TaxID=436907 RepID=A7TT49_VANPO|nr:uncharacterized protein Kpol_284p1 [Vanderwaltozyma polyspora DSM 70294]EDO14554.1 hypothetical protein Kpol_284p1 [Vanderwaltozyma polyspora DSM 70294]